MVSETGDQERIMVTRQRMRPPPIKNGWALIVIAVTCVIFMALTLWWTTWWSSERRSGADARLTDTEVMHQLATRLRTQWPQVPGPPDVYEKQAAAAVGLGDVQQAHRRTTMSLALSPDDRMHGSGW